jgi:DMSO/TMAO reductase YedYZ molybdopterin-dependent catalytic subunit
MRRKLFVASSLASLGLAGCTTSLKDQLTQRLNPVLQSAQGAELAVIGSRGLAREYPDSAIDHDFRTNGNDPPADSSYASLMQDGWRRYKLVVDGLVERPQALTLAELRAMPQQTQTTRHDCVEGWSIVGKWRGVQLKQVLAMAQPKPNARFVVMYCMDQDDQGTPFYGSLNLPQAAHPQTLLALDLNEKPLDAAHGAPVRLRIPTQLGYKSSKWVRRISFVDSFAKIGQGQGGYWEDNGYQWYAGI